MELETNVYSTMDDTYAYVLNHQARALEPIYMPEHQDTDLSQYVVGTCELNANNEIHLIGYDDQSNAISSIIYKHPDQVLSLSPCPKDHSLLFTCHMNSNLDNLKSGCTLWKMPDCELLSKQNPSVRSLLPLSTMKADDKDNIKKVIWDDDKTSNKMFTINEFSVNLWNLSNDMSQCLLNQQIFNITDSEARVSCGVWESERQNFIIGYEDKMVGKDIRSNKTAFDKGLDHMKVTCIALNNKLNYQLATGGFDGKVKIWDTRNLNQEIKVYESHTHWVYSLDYNSNYDELMLSSGSDNRIQLYSNPNLSSIYSFNLNEDQKYKDKLVASYEQHEDSVYSTKWSSSNPWLFASLSYDGQVLFHKVPDALKYRILL